MFYQLIRLALLFPAMWTFELATAAAENGTNAAATSAATNPPPALTFEVRQYEVAGNTLLSMQTLEAIFTGATGPAVTYDQIRKALGDLQLAYRERGYLTVGISLPSQKLTNAIVKVLVSEGRLVDVRVTGNQFFSSNNVLRALPTLKDALIWKDEVINSHVLQHELDAANQNRDRQIYPSLEPGPANGTSALVLKVKDRFPLHARADFDNYSTPGTPDWRINLSAQFNNLWQREHQLGVSYGFSPESAKVGGLIPDYLFDEPQISYYGAYYRIPFGAPPLADEIKRSPNFGYNEATHQFNLPPSADRPDITFYASASSADTGVKHGPLQTVTNNATLDITTQTSGRNFSVNENLGGRFTLPEAIGKNSRVNFYAGADYKRYALTIFGTNTTIQSVFFDPATGVGPVAPIVDASGDPPIRNSLHYFPVNAGFDYSENDTFGSTSLTLNGSFNFSGGTANFAALAYSPGASEHYGKLNLSFSREQKMYGEWTGAFVRGGGQWATGPLISNEQFPVGGLNSVRGYYMKGMITGMKGGLASIEFRTPYWNTRVASLQDFVPAWVRASVFVDFGQTHLLDAPAGVASLHSLMGTGFRSCWGMSITTWMRAAIAVGWPLFDTANTPAGAPALLFVDRRTVLMKLTLTILFAAAANFSALANPQGMTVQGGTANATISGSQLTIAVSPSAVLNWQNFNIAPGETTVFQQPSANSIVLNRIADQNPSQIYGSLLANGVVILENHSGFYFGPDSFVKAAGLVLSTAPSPCRWNRAVVRILAIPMDPPPQASIRQLRASRKRQEGVRSF